MEQYKSEIKVELKNNNNLDCMIDVTFRNISRLLFISFKNVDNDPARKYFGKYYILLVEMEGFEALIGSKPFFDQSVKIKQEAYEKLFKLSRSNNYVIRNLLDFTYYQDCYKLISIGLSGQTNITIRQQISFTEKLEENDGTKISVIAENKQKTLF